MLQDEVGTRRARAELLLLDGRAAEAAEELRKALRVADDYDSARIAARLAEISPARSILGHARLRAMP
jgi:predicted Zn-dependent protease